MELGIGRMHPDLMKIVGQLRYRYSYAQNVLRHSIEVGHMCGLLAQEMGINPKLAKRAGSGVLLSLRASVAPSGGNRPSR